MEELRIAAANWEYGGIDAGNLKMTRWQETVDVLRAWDPHLVLCQEMTGLFPWKLNRHAWRTANALGMVPLLGSSGPQTATGNRPAILVSLKSGVVVVDHGPPPTPLTPPWCEATLTVPVVGDVRVYSVHLPAFSGTLQMESAEWLTARIAQHGAPSVVCGDWNSYSGEGMDETPDLSRLPPHLIPTRMHVRHGNRSLNTRVHQLLTDMGLRDVAVIVPPERRTPHQLRPTGATGIEREFRGYVTEHLADLVSGYDQVPIGSDHQAFMFTLASKRM